jgi:hypothetical protein
MEVVMAKFSIASRNVSSPDNRFSGPGFEPLPPRLHKITNDQKVTVGPVELQAKTITITPRLWVRI